MFTMCEPRRSFSIGSSKVKQNLVKQEDTYRFQTSCCLAGDIHYAIEQTLNSIIFLHDTVFCHCSVKSVCICWKHSLFLTSSKGKSVLETRTHQIVKCNVIPTTELKSNSVVEGKSRRNVEINQTILFLNRRLFTSGYSADVIRPWEKKYHHY